MGYIEELRELVGHKCIILNGSAVILRNRDGLILMQQRKYPHGKWGLPGGLMELGESTIDTARRELFEETGLTVGSLKLLGVYSGENYFCSAQNGDEWYVVTTTYISDDFSGNLSVHDDESLAFEWFDPYHIPDNTAKTHKIMIADYLNQI